MIFIQQEKNLLLIIIFLKKKIKSEFIEIEKKIIKILDTKIRPAVAKDGGDIKFKEFKDGCGKSGVTR